MLISFVFQGRLNPALAKERPGFGGGFSDEDSKFSGNWRRDGPLPPFKDSHERRFDGPASERASSLPSISDEANDWRSSRPLSKAAEPEAPSARRKGSGFSITEGQAGAADREEHWTMGSRFKPSEEGHGKFGSVKGKFEPVQARDAPDEGDWRAARRAPGGTSRGYLHQYFLCFVGADLLAHSKQLHSSNPSN